MSDKLGLTSVTINDANEIIVGGVFDMASDTLTLTLAATDAGGGTAASDDGGGTIKKTFTLEAVAALPTTLTIVEGGIAVHAVGDLDGDGFDDLIAQIDGDDAGNVKDEAVFIAGHGFPVASTTLAIEDQVPGLPEPSDADAYEVFALGVGDIDADGRLIWCFKAKLTKSCSP